ncbi:MAG: LD-carboxypeptidase [Desulfobulbaceae bacterium]|nr:LD-carboxypeptidase [Desulfobulbaceae bacterium]HIJ89620.1 LD-carboxypeptidase [Deltaproteobacteria bacterium]
MNATPEPILAAPLKKGDTIGIVAPAGPVRNEGDFAAGLKLLTDLGFKTRYQSDILRHNGYLAGTDHERLAELHDLWRDPEVKAILAVRGGYGCLRLLPDLDFALIRRQPKMLIGFSDLTVLLSAIQQKTGLITFHGPMLTTLARSDRESQEGFFDLLTGRSRTEIKIKGLEILKGGQASGRLLPGNLTSLVHLLGTPFEPDWQDTILVLEDIGEAPYRIDRLLSHLAAAGRLSRIAGLILGDFDQCGDIELIWQRSLELLSDRQIPIWANFPMGHGSRNQILPLGAEARLDSTAGRLILPEHPAL